MLTVRKMESPKGVLFQLEGTIDENTDFDKLFGDAPKIFGVHCGGVTRLNSVGILAWMKYFSKAQKQGAKIVFMECSPPIVTQVNAISNFVCGGMVHSIHLGFTCFDCGFHFVESHKCDELKKAGMAEVPDRKCPKCGGSAPFDDMPEEYFAFLLR